MISAWLVGLIILSSVYVVRRYMAVYHTLTTIPTLGPSGFFSTYWGVLKYLYDAPSLLQKGYRKYRNEAFKVYTQDGWVIFVSGPTMLDEIEKAGDDQLSFVASANEFLQVEHTMGHEVAVDPWHIGIVRGKLMQNLLKVFPAIREEVLTSIAELIPPSDDWISVPINATSLKIVSRVSNRIFVGLPLCRNEEYLNIAIDHTIHVIVASSILRVFPGILRPLVSTLLGHLNGTYKKTKRLLEPIIRQRLEDDDRYGNKREGRPNDWISWMLDVAQGPRRCIRDFTLRVLFANFAAIHTTSMSLVHVFYDLASHPDSVDPLRGEIERVVSEYGWSKQSIERMPKLDSFLKESMRFWGLGAISGIRMSLKEFTFSNGQTISSGHHIYMLSRATHLDEALYCDPEKFEPFRFAELKETSGRTISQRLVAVDSSWLPFGYGSHACPGRFFASNELKQILAHVLLTYDVKVVNKDARPKHRPFGTALVIDTKFQLLFRKRQT